MLTVTDNCSVFYARLLRTTGKATYLPTNSESCKTKGQHIRLVEQMKFIGFARKIVYCDFMVAVKRSLKKNTQSFQLL